MISGDLQSIARGPDGKGNLETAIRCQQASTEWCKLLSFFHKLLA